MKPLMLIGLRGDLQLLDRQLTFQGATRHSLMTRDVIIIGDLFGGANLVCTPRNPPKVHEEGVLLTIVINLLHRDQQTIWVPGKLDMLLLNNGTQYLNMVSGNMTQRQAFLRTMNAQRDSLLSCMSDDLLLPELGLSISQMTDDLHQVKVLCANQKPEAWPTPFIVNGEKYQPMCAACFMGCDGMELHGLLGDAVFAAIASAKELASSECAQRFFDTLKSNASTKLEAHRRETEMIESISVCFKQCKPHHVSMTIAQKDRRLRWSTFKQEFIDRFRADIAHLAAEISDDDVFSALDSIMIQN